MSDKNKVVIKPETVNKNSLTNDNNSLTNDKNGLTNDNNRFNLDSMSVDDILLNLKIISCIRTSDRLSKNKENILEIETDDLLQGIRRWWFGRSRNETISSIKKIIQSAFEITDKTLDNENSSLKQQSTFYDNKSKNNYFNEENSSLLQRFVIELNSACRGLDNLKLTYKDDTRIVSEISILKEQMELRIKKINNILKIDTACTAKSN